MIQDNYQNTLDWLFSQFPSYQQLGAPAYKPGLENTQTLLSYFGNPQDSLRFIHVAGTNGKGSTCSYLASFLSNENEKVGLFTSPHIYDFRERIRVNGNMISEQEVLDFCGKVKDMDLKFQPSFFEITLAMALVHFSQQQCTWVVLETGMGGRLDATNVILPETSIITNIGFDHTQFLGHTLEEIAVEKAGIIKPNVPVVIGKQQKETSAIFEQFAKVNNSPIYFAEDEKSNSLEIEKHDLPLYQVSNLVAALTCLKILGFNVQQTKVDSLLKNLHRHTGIFGRLTKIQEKPSVYLDVSHNSDGIKETLRHIKPKGKLHIIYGCSEDKDMLEILALFPNDCAIYLCTFSNTRSKTHEELKITQEADARIMEVYHNVNLALKQTKALLEEHDILLVTGSFFLISDVDQDVCNFSE